MADVAKIVDVTSDSITYFDFYNAAGTGNPGTLKTRVMSYDLGSDRPDADVFEPETLGDPSLARYSLPPVQMMFVLRCEASSWDNLVLGLGTLKGYLLDPKRKRLLWQPETAAAKLYADLITGEVRATLAGQGLALERLALKDKIAIDVPVVILREPGWRGAMQTFGPTTIPNDPADSNGRVFQLTVPGDMPAPAEIMFAGDSTAKVQEIVTAVRSRRGWPATRVTDWANTTKRIELDTTSPPSGVTVAHSNNTANATETTDGSGADVAETTPGSDFTTMLKRIRVTRSTLIDSLRGELKVYVRCKATGAGKFVPQLRWGMTSQDPTPHTLPEAEPINTTGHTSFDYTDHYLGTIFIPEDHPIGLLAFELWLRRESGAGNFRWDFISFVPADESFSRVIIPTTAEEIWYGNQMQTPPTEPGGLAAAEAAGTALRFDSSPANQAAGTPPGAGVVLPVGRHIYDFAIPMYASGAGVTFTCRVRNITTDATPVSKQQTSTALGVALGVTLEFDVTVASQFFQAQVQFDSGTGDFYLAWIKHRFRPYIANGEMAHLDPERHLAHKMDASENILFPIDSEGALPHWLPPGEVGIYAHFRDVPIQDGAPPASKIARDLPVTVRFEPRYMRP